VLKARRSEAVTLAVSAFIVLVLNVPFWKLLYAAIAPRHFQDWLFLTCTAAVLLLLTNLLLSVITNHRALRVVLAVILPATAAASYFMYEYGVLIDENMIRNVFETNSAEARDLLSIKMLAAIACLGILPAYLVWQTPWIERPSGGNLKAALRTAAISLPLIAVLGFPFWGTVLSAFREHSELRMTLTPWNITSGLRKYLRHGTALAATNVAPYGEDATRAERPETRTRKSIAIIVIGETARADHFALNGYARPTNPELSKIEGLINFPQAFSCGTDTAQSVPCMFSGLGRSEFSNNRASAQENLLDILKRAGVDVIWRENQSGCKGVCQRTATETLTSVANSPFSGKGENNDEILLDGLDDRIAKLERDTVIVLHMMGSHGPAYWKRYPDAREAFTPVCRETVFSHCTSDEIINAYDNTILYTDFVLGKLAKILSGASTKGVDAAMWYMSDHGESLGENNLYLHGMPYGIAPEAQIHIPMVLWMSQSIRDAGGIDQSCMAKNAAAKTSHDALFHSVLGLMDVKTKVYDASLDLFAPCRSRSSS
jgi:lipid A ethanolaminephosphotransferase